MNWVRMVGKLMEGAWEQLVDGRIAGRVDGRVGGLLVWHLVGLIE